MNIINISDNLTKFEKISKEKNKNEFQYTSVGECWFLNLLYDIP